LREKDHVTGKLPAKIYYCTENKHAEKPATLKQPEQIQKKITANQNGSFSQLT